MFMLTDDEIYPKLIEIYIDLKEFGLAKSLCEHWEKVSIFDKRYDSLVHTASLLLKKIDNHRS